MSRQSMGLCAAILVSTVALPSEARDRPRVLPGDVWLPIGVLSSVSTHPGGRDYLGIGGEVSVVQFGGGVWTGAFVQAQALGWLNDLDLDRHWHPRIAAGFEGGWRFFGIEAGLAFRGAYPDGVRNYGAVLMTHVAPVLTMGMASLTMPIGVPMAMLSEGAHIPLEIGGAFTLKLPIRLTP